MNYSSVRFLYWYVSKFKTLVRVDSSFFLLAIVCLGLSKVLRVLNFFIPIKILLIASNEYFNWLFLFKPTMEKEILIGILISIFLFLILLCTVLEILSKKLAKDGAQNFLFKYGATFLHDKFFEVSTFDLFLHVRIASNAIFFLVAFCAISYLSPVVCFSVIGFILVLYLLIKNTYKGHKTKLISFKKLMIERVPETISFLEMISVFFGFLIVIYQLLVSDSNPILLSIFVFILLRQALSALALFILDCIGIINKSGKASFFGTKNISFATEEFAKTFKDIHPSKLQGLLQHAARLITDNRPPPPLLQTAVWNDSGDKFVAKLIISLKNSIEKKEEYLLRVTPKKMFALELSETYLFRFIKRKDIAALPLRESFQYEQLKFNIFEHHRLLENKQDFQKVLRGKLLERIWSFAPPPLLVADCEANRLMLFQRLTASNFQNLWLAAQSVNERKLVDIFFAKLPEIVSRLKNMPVFLCNPSITLENVTLSPYGDALLVNWWNWSVEPLGGGRQCRYDLNKLTSYLAQLKEKRNDIPDAFRENDLLFAQQCQLVEDQILNFRFAAALQTCSTLISLLSQA